MTNKKSKIKTENFENDSYDDEYFDNIDNDKETINSKEFYGCTFSKCSFLESTLEECQFEKCKFEACNLSLIKVKNNSFIDVEFRNSKILGVNWSEVATPLSVDFFECTINHSTFSSLDLRKMKVIDCEARDVDFSGANLTLADFELTDLKDAHFMNSNLTGADFSSAKKYSINPNINILKKTKFSLPEAISLLNNFDIILN